MHGIRITVYDSVASVVVTVDFGQNQPERPRSRLEEGEVFEPFASERENSLTMGFWDT